MLPEIIAYHHYQRKKVSYSRSHIYFCAANTKNSTTTRSRILLPHRQGPHEPHRSLTPQTLSTQKQKRQEKPYPYLYSTPTPQAGADIINIPPPCSRRHSSRVERRARTAPRRVRGHDSLWMCTNQLTICPRF